MNIYAKTGRGVALAIFFFVCLNPAYSSSVPNRSNHAADATTRQSAKGAESPHTNALLDDAKALFQQGKFSDADHAVRQFLETHPDSAEAHFLRGHILFREVQTEGLLEIQFQSPAQDQMGGVKVLVPNGGDSAESDAKAREQKVKVSLSEFTAGAKYHDPAAADLKTVALDYVLLGDYPDADKWLTKMLGWAPNDSDGWYYLGRTKHNENRFTEAINAFQRCLALDPKNVKAEENLGLSLAGLGRNEEAVAAYQQAIAWQAQSAAKNPSPYIDFASLLIDQNRLQEAVTYLLEAVEIAPREERTHELLGKAYTRLEDFPKAQNELEKAAALSPRSANLHCMLAPVYRKQGLADKAKAEFDRCAALTGSRSTPETPRQ